MWKTAIILILVPRISTATCGVSTSRNLPDKIVGGRNAEEDEFPWQASLQRATSLGFLHICGASLVTPEWLVTAAHCIRSKAGIRLSADSYLIMIGNNNLSDVTTNELYLIKMIVIKQGFDPHTFHNDIALIQLFRPVPDFLTPICLTEKAPIANSTAIVTGWGATSNGGKVSQYLQAADVIIIPTNECLKYYELTESMTCAGYEEGKIDACQGDSGGPLQQWREEKAYLVGIVSWGIGCAEPGHPGVYTEVTQFVPWIRTYIESVD